MGAGRPLRASYMFITRTVGRGQPCMRSRLCSEAFVTLCVIPGTFDFRGYDTMVNPFWN